MSTTFTPTTYLSSYVDFTGADVTGADDSTLKSTMSSNEWGRYQNGSITIFHYNEGRSHKFHQYL